MPAGVAADPGESFGEVPAAGSGPHHHNCTAHPRVSAPDDVHRDGQGLYGCGEAVRDPLGHGMDPLYPHRSILRKHAVHMDAAHTQALADVRGKETSHYK